MKVKEEKTQENMTGNDTTKKEGKEEEEEMKRGSGRGGRR